MKSKHQELIISIHIPRTGGTSLKAVLAEIYGDRFVWMQQANSAQEAYEKLKSVDWHDIQCIHGHIGYGLHNFIPSDISCKYITFLRDPRERILSLYHFIFREETYNAYQWGDRCDWKKDVDFLSWLQRKLLAMQDNQMTRFFSEKKRLNTKAIIKDIDYDDYSLAIANLNRFYFIGATECLDDCLLKLAAMLGWKELPDVPKEYSYPDRRHYIDTNDQEKELIKKTQYYDLLLYDHYARTICKQ